jgi:hypothetical protein
VGEWQTDGVVMSYFEFDSTRLCSRAVVLDKFGILCDAFQVFSMNLKCHLEKMEQVESRF